MTGGWTGGHVFPIKSLLEYININKDFVRLIDKIYWVGKAQSLENEMFLSIKDKMSYKIRFVSILSGKYRREKSFIARIKNIRDIFLFITWTIQSFFFLLFKRIDVIFCKWWYVALPVVVAWAILRKKILVHESDTKSGLVNRIGAKFAKHTYTWFSHVLPNSTTVWQILSDDIVVQKSENFVEKEMLVKDEFESKLSNLDKNKTTIFVSWWSQWSRKLYQTLLNILHKKDIDNHFQFIVTLGKLNQDMKKDLTKFDNVHVFDFLSQKQMWFAYFISDISLTRAGTTSLAEQKLYDQKIIMIPIPWTHDQYKNAEYYVDKYWDELVDQNKSKFEEILYETLLDNVGFKKKMKNKDRLAEIHKAKKIICDELFKID